MSDTLTFLDCTLRDGGYYNNWNFDHAVVQRYINASAKAGVDVLELGFRTLGAEVFLGPYAHTTDALLRRHDLPASMDYAVMVNASDLANHPGGIQDAVAKLFAPADESPVDIIRLAAHMTHVPQLPAMVEAMVELGYRVGANLMQVSRFSGEDVAQAAKTLQAAGGTEVLYFADSFGDMTRQDIIDRVEQVGTGWDGPIGLHAHDNRKLGLTNVLEAVDQGVTWIDGTIRGMGRGAGNAATEFILSELRLRGMADYDEKAYVSVVMEDFRALHQAYEWGADLLYVMAAEHTVHPTYVQMMNGDSRYDLADIVGAIEALGRSEGHSYRAEMITVALSDGSEATGTWDATGWCDEQDVLILGAGPELTTHLAAVESYVRERAPLVLCLNTTSAIDESLVDGYVACHPTRMALEADQLASLHAPLIAPRSMIESIGIGDADIELRDYGVDIAPHDFTASATGCRIPGRLAFAYALAAVTAGGAARVLLVGMDGFPGGDPRQEEMLDVFHAYADHGGPDLIALTPTSYPVRQSSVYAPEA